MTGAGLIGVSPVPGGPEGVTAGGVSPGGVGTRGSGPGTGSAGNDGARGGVMVTSMGFNTDGSALLAGPATQVAYATTCAPKSAGRYFAF